MVGERGQELVQQIAVRRVNFQDLETRGQRPVRGGLERGDYTVDAGLVECYRHWVGVIEGQRTGTDHRPSPVLRRLECGGAFPGCSTTCLTASVGELDASHGSLIVEESGDTPQALYVRSSQIPTSPGVMRPSHVTEVASTITSPVPPAARLPR